MKKILLTILGFVAMFSANAQTFTVQADTVRATYNSGILALHDNITNMTNDSTFKITWSVTACNFPTSWTTDTAFGICDNSNCQSNTGGQLLPPTSTIFTSTNPYLPNQAGDFHLQLDLHYPSAVSVNGTYYCVVNLRNGSYNRPIVFQVSKWATGVSNVNKNNDNVTLYPNPAKNNLYLNYSGPEAIKTISVYNLIGKMVHTYKATSNNVQLDIDDIPSGVYYLRLVDGQGSIVATRRFTHQ